MAQSWNPDLVCKMGEAVGDEMREAGLSIWLAPGANLHRNPLCGRNYQYYAEDPFLTGTMLTAEVFGGQSRGGVFCCAKHFAANNMEANRGEWMWDGFVMDDYTPWFFLCWRDLTVCPQVGNDLVMPGNTADNIMPVPFVPMENPVANMECEGKTGPFQSDTDLMHIALRDGRLLLGDLQRSAMAILNIYMKTQVFAELRSAVKQQNIQPTRA